MKITLTITEVPGAPAKYVVNSGVGVSNAKLERSPCPMDIIGVAGVRALDNALKILEEGFEATQKALGT